MSSAKLTLIGMYNYDQTLFNELVMPEGIDKDLFIQSLLMQSGEFEVLYPQPDFMKYSIKIWSTKWFRTFSEWLRGTQQRWNPIYNYDRFEESRNNNKKDFSSKTMADYSDQRRVDLDDTRTADLQDKRIADLRDTRTADLKDKTTFDNTDTNTQTDSMTTEHSVAAYDTSDYSPSSKDVVNNGQTKTDHTGTVENGTSGTDINDHTGTDTMKHTGTDIMKHTGTDNTARKGTLSDQAGSEATEDIHEAHLYGNIGVTTSAAMLKEFYDISSWSLYEHMCDVFTSELLIPVYD